MDGMSPVETNENMLLNSENVIGTRPIYAVAETSPQKNTYSPDSSTGAIDRVIRDIFRILNISLAVSFFCLSEMVGTSVTEETQLILHDEEFNSRTCRGHIPCGRLSGCFKRLGQAMQEMVYVA